MKKVRVKAEFTAELEEDKEESEALDELDQEVFDLLAVEQGYRDVQVDLEVEEDEK